MLVQDIYNFIDELAPFSYAMSFDNSGLLLGDRQNPVKKILVALDCKGHRRKTRKQKRGHKYKGE